MVRQKTNLAAAGSVRIIAGQWRGRRLTFPGCQDLRPTGDRLREMLFNWLQPHWAGARCLDLFAGSGALGLEAASRGAVAVTLVERAPAAAYALRANCALLGADAVEVVEGDALDWLVGPPPAQPYDIVFVDPPFADAALDLVLQTLAGPGWLAAPGWVYVETARHRIPPAVPPGWSVHREKLSGGVHCRLYRCV